MKWSNLQQLLVRASAVTTHSIINMNEPAVLAAQMSVLKPSPTAPESVNATPRLACSKNNKLEVNNLAAHQNMLLYITRSMEKKLEFFTIIWHTEDFLKIGQ